MEFHLHGVDTLPFGGTFFNSSSDYSEIVSACRSSWIQKVVHVFTPWFHRLWEDIEEPNTHQLYTFNYIILQSCLFLVHPLSSLLLFFFFLHFLSVSSLLMFLSPSVDPNCRTHYSANLALAILAYLLSLARNWSTASVLFFLRALFFVTSSHFFIYLSSSTSSMRICLYTYITLPLPPSVPCSLAKLCFLGLNCLILKPFII